MAYTTEAAVRVASGFNNTTNIITGTMTTYIADADSVIDAAVGDRYLLPLSATPQIIETISRHITVGLLYSNEYGEETENLDKGWKNRLDWAMEQLEKIKEGKLKLYDTDGSEITRSSHFNPAFYPDDDSSDLDAVDTTAPKLTMNEQF